MSKLEKELVGYADKTEEVNEAVVEDVKLLLTNNASEEREILRSIGLDNDIKYVEGKNEDNMIRSNNKGYLGKTIVHESEIKKLCANYRLYMRQAKQYVGSIPPDLGAELNRFAKDKNLAIASHADQSDFFIIAPPKMFSSYTTPLGILNKSFDDTVEFHREKVRQRKLDPILVYRLREKGYYAIIKSWGEDITWLRRTYGELTKGYALKLMNVLACTMVLLGLFRGLQWVHHVMPKLQGSIHPLTIVIDCIGFVAALLFLFNDIPVKFRRSILGKVRRDMYGATVWGRGRYED